MADSPANPVPPIPPAQPTPANETHVSRRSQFAALVLLLLVAGLIGWRWYADRFRTRPSELERDVAHRVDLNKASKSELLQIPGVGPQLAERIVAERDAKGRFESVDELKGVHGIGDATLNKIRPWVTVEPVETQPQTEPDRLIRKPVVSAGRINLNTATLEQLQTLPNIGPVLAQRIIVERQKKPFEKVEDLRRVSGIGPKRLEAIRELVTVE